MAKRVMGEMANEAMPVEAELRLTGDPAVLEAAFGSPVLALAAGCEERVAELDSRYFDTPDLALRAQGLAFRVRASDAGYHQTLKAGDDVNAAVLKRGEWETPLDDDQPLLEALPRSARARLPKAALKGGLQPTFTTRMRRRSREIVIPGEGRVEAALDLGRIDAGGADMPIAEIELELLEGRPEALYRLALRLQDIGPLRLETRSKSARAFDRLTDRPPAWQRADMPALDPGHSVDDAMAAIFESCFLQWLANQAAAVDGRDPEGVHQLRVALRRLRSAFSVFRKAIPPDQLAWLGDGARQALGALGPARDWDVFQAELLAPVIEARPDDSELDALRLRARARCRAAYQRARRHLQGDDYTRFVLQFGEWLEQRAWRRGTDGAPAADLERPITDFAGRLLAKRHKRVLAKGDGFADLSPVQRHDLRIAFKKLRYSIEFVQSLFDRRALKPFLRCAKALQENLGRLNDVAVAETLMAGLLARPGRRDIRRAAGLVIGWHARGVAVAEPDLRRDWAMFEAAPVFWR